jgi:hypothetical protein
MKVAAVLLGMLLTVACGSPELPCASPFDVGLLRGTSSERIARNRVVNECAEDVRMSRNAVIAAVGKFVYIPVTQLS